MCGLGIERMSLRITLYFSILFWSSLALLPAVASTDRAKESFLKGHQDHWVSLLELNQKKWKPETVLRPKSQASPETLMYEVTRFPDREPTSKEIYRASKFVQASFRAARKNGWLNVKKARADGFSEFYADPTHFVNKEYVRDKTVLNPNRPEYLMYYPHPEKKGEMLLVGVMYLARKPLDHGPQIGGSMTLWHYHIWCGYVAYCTDQFYAAVGEMDDAGACSAGKPVRYSPEMLHVWFIKHPRGPFSPLMRVPLKALENVSYKEMAGRILGEGGVEATPLERAGSAFKPKTMDHHHHAPVKP